MNAFHGRRPFLRRCGALALATLALPARAQSAAPGPRRLCLAHTHTG